MATGDSLVTLRDLVILEQMAGTQKLVGEGDDATFVLRQGTNQALPTCHFDRRWKLTFDRATDDLVAQIEPSGSDGRHQSFGDESLGPLEHGERGTSARIGEHDDRTRSVQHREELDEMPLVRRQRSQRAGEDRIESRCAVRGLACLVADQLGSEQRVTAGRGHDLIGELVATLRREFRGHLGDQLSNVVGGQVVQPDLTDEVDSFELGAQPTGSRMAVEWARGNDPVHVGDGPAHHVLQCRHGGRVEPLNVIEGDGEVTLGRGRPKACHDPVGDARPPRFAVLVRVLPATGDRAPARLRSVPRQQSRRGATTRGRRRR